MKKIYLDWNVINHLDEELYDFILKNQSHFVYVYSPAHFSDLMRGQKEGKENTYFAEDLKRLETICETHLMRYEKTGMHLYKCLPSEFFEKEGEVFTDIESAFKPSFYKKAFSSIEPCLYDAFIKDLSSVDFGKEVEIPLLGKFSNALEFYDCLLSFLDGVFSDDKKSKRFKMELTKDIPFKEINAVNDQLPKDVVGAMEELLSRYGFKDKLVDVVRNSLNDDQKDNEMLLFNMFYLILDFLRYRSDRKGLWNILSDTEHAFYGSYCDVLVTNDDRMKYKTEAVYSCLGIKTEIVRELELLDYLKNTIAKEDNVDEHLKEVLSDQHIPIEYEEGSLYYRWTILNSLFFGFFNKIEYFLNLTSRQCWFRVSRDRTFEKCTYYSETDKFFEIMKGMLQMPEMLEEFEAYVDKFKAKDPSALFGFHLSQEIQATLVVKEEEGMFVPFMVLAYIRADGALSTLP